MLNIVYIKLGQSMILCCGTLQGEKDMHRLTSTNIVIEFAVSQIENAIWADMEYIHSLFVYRIVEVRKVEIWEIKKSVSRISDGYCHSRELRRLCIHTYLIMKQTCRL